MVTNAVPSGPRGAIEMLGSGPEMRLSVTLGYVAKRHPLDGLSRASEAVGFALDDL